MLCQVDTQALRDLPVFIKDGNNTDLYVRVQNSTRLLTTADTVASRWADPYQEPT